MIYTTYFAKLKTLPSTIVPISICGKAPTWHDGLQYKQLAPKWAFFQEWKRTNDNQFYVRCFNEQVLAPLAAEQVVTELYLLAGGKNVALVCYEKPGDFCHRHLVAEWLKQNGFLVKEWGVE